MYQKILLCFGKVCCAPGKFLVFWKRLLCFRLDCCVLEKIVALSKILLCSSKDCCVSEQELSCVLPVWATVHVLIRDISYKDSDEILSLR